MGNTEKIYQQSDAHCLQNWIWMSCFTLSALQTRHKVKPDKGGFLMVMEVNWYHSAVNYNASAVSAVINVQ